MQMPPFYYSSGSVKNEKHPYHNVLGEKDFEKADDSIDCPCIDGFPFFLR
jgi:hypothetical protein